MYDNKKIFILGIARSGFEVAKLLSGYTKEILITDMKEKEEDIEHISELKKLGIDVHITENQADLLDDSFDLVVKNPGVPLNAPVVLKAEELNIPVINEMEVTFNLLPEGVKIIGTTGSNGKTTTTQITYEILKKAGLPAILGGNIGIPVSGLLKDIKKGDILVWEISSHQLVNLVNLKTNISILTNLTPTHLDFFNGYEDYTTTKKKIFNHHTKEDIAIINNGNSDCVNLTIDVPSKKITFGDENSDLLVSDDAIYYNKEQIIKLSDIKLVGMHNYENIMCAIAVAKEFNVSNEVIKEVLHKFGGVEHRLEFVKEVNKIKFYNDSKSTNCVSTIVALNSFKVPTTIILGGMDRGHSFDELKPHMGYVEKVVAYGETRDRIKTFCDSFGMPCSVVETITEATKEAYESTKENGVVVLSPACASWDQYDCFEDRGADFKKNVNDL